jgi:hypothetical protein
MYRIIMCVSACFLVGFFFFRTADNTSLGRPVDPSEAAELVGGACLNYKGIACSAAYGCTGIAAGCVGGTGGPCNLTGNECNDGICDIWVCATCTCAT